MYSQTNKEFNGIYIDLETQMYRTAFYRAASAITSFNLIYLDTVKTKLVVIRPNFAIGYQWRKKNVIVDIAFHLGASFKFRNISEQKNLEDVIVSLESSTFLNPRIPEFSKFESTTFGRFIARLGYQLEWD
jgi:hypothetical protein